VPTRRRVRAALWRIVWMSAAVSGLALIYPWRSVENISEIEQAQMLIDEMSAAHRSVAVTRDSSLDEYTRPEDGSQGLDTQTPGGVPAAGLIGLAGENCLIMHWTTPEEAQVGRLPAQWPCVPESVAVVPLAAHEGYVPGTGPPFDVTPLIREAHTPAWFIAALIALAAIGLKAGADLFLILVRPDAFFSDRERS
jgi:hypothetical protein